ncbi:MAG: SWF/SNF helicase family protein [Planctomycetaceae bacterium]|nr:SWF/SNF helicase family protein [Planctomycetaceae bacterium]
MNPDFRNLPDDLSGAENVERRRAVARHLVQRRRADIRNYLGETIFPTRMESEVTYSLSPQGRALFNKLMKYSRELVKEPGLEKWHLRVRWWSALALLRGLSSSPDAVAAMLRRRAGVIDCETLEEVDRLGGHDLLDRDGDGDDAADMMPGADVSDSPAESPATRKRLFAFAKEAEALSGKNDPKLQSLITMTGTLLKDGFHPIVFCRFIPTAKYVAEYLRKAYPGVGIAAVTGETVPEERKVQVDALLGEKQRILVCTDCLSEGINLQEGFDAVVHYDLSWNPTRHEQRDGRVDRYGQRSPEIRIATLYGSDNPIDGMVLEVLLRKHKAIRSSLGVSIPVPTDSDKVVEALFEALLLREERTRGKTGQGSLFDASELIPVAHQMANEWDNASAREKRSQTFYAQQTIKPEEVKAELERVRDAIGAGVDVRDFVVSALRDHGCVVTEKFGVWNADLSRCPESLRDTLDSEHLKFGFADTPVLATGGKVELYTRTHPQVERLAAWMLNAALDPHDADCVVRRCGTIRTNEVATRTTLLLLRLRFQLIHKSKRLLSEECRLVAFTGPPDSPHWLSAEEVHRLMTVNPTGNDPADVVKRNLDRALTALPALQPALDTYAVAQGEALLEAHNRVRSAWSRDARRGPGLGKKSGVDSVEPQLPPDVLGLYVYIPDPRQH